MSTLTEHPPAQARVHSRDAIRTWGYLRLTMIGVVVGLGVAVLYEHFHAPHHCWQTSISAYYYTPARGYFVGALTAIAVCMVCLRGNTELEDVLLNLGGMLAPIVAFVPTPDAGGCTSARSALESTPANVANNVTALLVVGLLALVFAAWRARRGERKPRIGFVAAVLVWLVTAVVFEADRHFFIHTAHYAAAVLLFACIVAVVVVNAFDFKDRGKARDRGNPTDRGKRKSVRNRYMLIAALMGVALGGLLIAEAAGYAYWLIVLETALLVLFGAFWVIQTVELWGHGLRGD